MEITKREILVSIAIICLMLVLGLIIQGSIRTAITQENKKYETAVEIEDPATFKYGMQTNVGNAFVYGPLVAVDPVSVKEISGEWMEIEKITERYTQHTRTVTKKVGKQTITEVQHYYTWDRISSETWHCTKVSFLGSEFDYGIITTPKANYIQCDRRGNYRDKWYTVPIRHVGTMFTNLHDGKIDKTDLYKELNIQQLKGILIKDPTTVIVLFRIFWIILTAGLCFWFYYLENRWLE